MVFGVTQLGSFTKAIIKLKDEASADTNQTHNKMLLNLNDGKIKREKIGYNFSFITFSKYNYNFFKNRKSFYEIRKVSIFSI
ncbi:hypothetical protein BpHYR1_006413 [Brachionus plicatilis]|uniref:Uncharacterized protein n=1 Tax=Brachionus plicatilis TaxID=10195 RepID=A0A3M7P1P3_BRAPC|nr:hypothetical protein BpHYR1_006413 [Brachionus plicatilis]